MGVVLCGGQFVQADTDPSLADLIARQEEIAVIALDMPLGLPLASAPRACDVQARSMVGPRRNSVFYAPPEEILKAATHADATKAAVKLTGRGISQQAFALREGIQVAAAVATKDRRVIEVHPEVSFKALADKHLLFGKRSWNGQHQRSELLLAHGIVLPGHLPGEAGGIAVDDVLDAAVAAWSANRYATNRAGSLTPGAQRGALQVIWY